MFREALLLSALAVSLGCSATVSESGGGGAREIEPDARPPTAGRAHTGNGPGVVFAMTKLFLGDIDRSGKVDLQAWRELGLDIDGVESACAGDACDKLEHCGAALGTSADVFADGARGIDNSFGAHLVDRIARGLLANDFSRPIARDLADGRFTMLIAIDGLGDDSEYNPLVARIYRGGDLGHAPKFDDGERWPIASDSRAAVRKLSASESRFEASFVTSDRWVSGQGELTLRLPLFGSRLDLAIHHAVVTMDLSEDRSEARNGTISGILDPNELASEVPRLAGAIDPTLCRSKGVAELSRELFQAADILADGRAGTRDAPCEGISIGLGFEATRTLLGDIVTEPALVDACDDETD